MTEFGGLDQSTLLRIIEVIGLGLYTLAFLLVQMGHVSGRE